MDFIEKTDKISVIVPIYNTYRYLDSCIMSIVEQTYSNIEILLIIDGSKDRSLELCREWEKRDNRIRVFDNDNHGVSYTRNFGIEMSTGEYIVFVDSDDLISNTYVETLYLLIRKNAVDMGAVKSQTFLDGYLPNYCNSSDFYYITENVEAALFENTDGFVWTKIYKANIIKNNKLTFKTDIYVCEDLLFNFEYVSFCTSIACCDSKLYGYRQRCDSAVHNNTSLKWFSCLDAYRILLTRYMDSCAANYIVFYYLKNLYEAKYLIRSQNILNEEICNNVFSEIKRIKQIKSKFSIKQKITLFICKYFFFAVIKRRK